MATSRDGLPNPVSGIYDVPGVGGIMEPRVRLENLS